MKLEICANSFQSAKNAEEAGAHRIELCSELAVGGITPSYGLIKQVVEELSIETYVLIRPRSGNFIYTDVEIEIMKNDIQTCKDLGCSGIVSGVLKEDNSLDVKRTKMLIEISKPLAFTFHRAFDCVSNPMETLESLVDLGVDRILTSGQESSVDDGLELLNQLKTKGGQNIIILPGGGVHPENTKKIMEAGFNEIHASASKPISNRNRSSYFGETQQTVSDKATIKAILKVIQGEN
jgi:copper homeostasis protein